MTLTSNRFDIEFLYVSQLAPIFNKFQASSEKTLHQPELSRIALCCLELMNKYQALHPSYTDMLDYLRYYSVNSIYDKSWAREIEGKTKDILESGKSKLQAITESTSDSLHPEDCHELFDQVKKCIIILIIQRDYLEAEYFLNNYATVVQFRNQPTPEDLVDNRYLEFLFLQYSINIFQNIWFPTDDSGVFTENKSISSNSFKPLETIFKKVSTYVTKNEYSFNSARDNHDELHYYWVIKILSLYLLFKQFRFIEFYDEFTSLFLNYESKSSNQNLTPLNFLINNNSILKSKLLLMFGIVSIFLKPNVSLSYMNEDILIDLFNENESSLEFAFYNKVLIPLSRRDLVDVHNTLEDRLFLERLIGNLEIDLPVGSTNKYSPNHSFIEYIWTIIDFKNFLVIMSATKQIARIRLIELLGYDLSDIEKVNQVSNNLIVLVSALDKTGIQYFASSELFIRTNKDKTDQSLELQSDIEELNNEVKGMTLSSMMTSILIEKYFN